MLEYLIIFFNCALIFIILCQIPYRKIRKVVYSLVAGLTLKLTLELTPEWQKQLKNNPQFVSALYNDFYRERLAIIDPDNGMDQDYILPNTQRCQSRARELACMDVMNYDFSSVINTPNETDKINENYFENYFETQMKNNLLKLTKLTPKN